MKPLDVRLLRAARATQVHLAVSTLLGLLLASLVLVQAELLSRGIASVIADGNALRAASSILLGVAAVVAGKVAIAWLQDSAAQRSAASAKSQLRRQLMAHVAAMSGPTSNDVVTRAEVATLATRGLDALDGYFGQYLPQLVLAIIVPVAVLVRLAAADRTAALTVAVTLPLIPVFMILVGRATEASNAKRWRALALLSHHFLDVAGGMVTLKMFGRGKAQADSVRTTNDRYRATTMETLRVAFLSSFVLELIATLSVALVAVGVGLRLVDGGLSLRTGLLVIVIAPEAYLPLRQVGARYHAAAEGIAAADRVFAILERPIAASGADTDVPDLRRDGAIEMSNISVNHPGRSGAAPGNVDLIARTGELVVVTGPSGAGKTTLLSLLLGARRPTLGDIRIIGAGRQASLSSLDLRTWRTQLAWVDQAPYLFAGTVAENVRLSKPEATAGEVRRALDAAGLEHIDVDRPVDEVGGSLSSGEQRRLAIARALLRDAPVVLLDEPTAGLDAATEADLLRVIGAMAERSVVIMVSHRPAAISAADRIVAVASRLDESDSVIVSDEPLAEAIA